MVLVYTKGDIMHENTYDLAWDFGDCGIHSVTIHYTYTPGYGDGWEDPRVDEEFEFRKVTLGDLDITALFAGKEQATIDAVRNRE